MLTRADAILADPFSAGAACELTDDARERLDSNGVVGRDGMSAFNLPSDGVFRTFWLAGERARSMTGAGCNFFA